MNEVARLREEKERASVIVRFVSFACSAYVLPLYLIFSVADFLWYSNFFYLFLAIRICSIILFMALRKVIVRFCNDLPSVQVAAAIFILFCALPIHLMLYFLPNADSPYYAGLILIMVGVATGLRFTWPYYFSCLAFIVLPFLIIGCLKAEAIDDSYFLLNLIFLISGSAISTVGRYFFEVLNEKEFKLRIELEDEVSNRGKIIDKKTKEALNLRSLSRQFSPQIVKSINDGKMDLKSELHQAEICAVFIDIKDSTKKLNSISPSQMQKLISMYVEDVMGLFLKYDITVDKFLGDGVMGFSNNPIAQEDYIERAVSCAFEILDRLSTKKDLYDSLWDGEFQVRIGISSGKATVGFYGSDLHVKSYTAIGRVINLAARINGIAPPNGVVITSDVMDKLNHRQSQLINLEYNPLKLITLKGFESENIALFEVKTTKNKHLLRNAVGNDDLCPNGHGVLFLDKNDMGLYVLKCRECNYILDESCKEDTKKTA